MHQPEFGSYHWHYLDDCQMTVQKCARVEMLPTAFTLSEKWPIRVIGVSLRCYNRHPPRESYLIKRKLWKMSDIVRSNFCRCVGVSAFRGRSEMFGFVPVWLMLNSKHLCL